jgi:hypothetical protein
MRRHGWVWLVGAALAVTGTAGAASWADSGVPAVLTVAPTGAGAACSAQVPCSLLQAQRLARTLDGTRDVTVELTGGTYRLTAPLAMDARDGGRDGHEVVYENAPGAAPLLSGGRQVTGWVPDASTGTWSAPVPKNLVSRELYADGQRLARTSSGPSAWVQTSDGYLTADTGVLAWRNPSDVELVFSMGNGFWTEPRCDVASVAAVPGGAAVRVRQPCWSNLHIPDTLVAGTDPDDNAMGGFEGLSAANPPSAIENVWQPLTTGQWYLDQPAGRLYYHPPAGVDPNRQDVELPVLQTLIDAHGSLDRPIEHLTIRGLTFGYTTWRQPSGDDGFAEMQANMTLTGVNASGSDPSSGRPPQGTCQYTTPRGTCPFAAWTKPPATVEFTAARGVLLERNRFVHVGAAAVDFSYGAKDDVIRGNEIWDTSGSGIQLGSTDDPLPSWVHADAREINERDVIEDNWIHDVAQEYHGAIGIWVGYTRDTVIAHNQIARTPYTAISFGWGGWHTDTLNPDNPSIVGHNLIADNLIYDYLTTTPDGGAIYTNGTQGPVDPAGPATDPFLTTSTSDAQMARGLMIRGNVALLATWAEFTYYNDEGSDYVTYDTNAEYQAHAFAHGGCNTVGHILMKHNYWAQPAPAYICPPPPVDIRIVDPHVLPDHPGPSDLPESLLKNAGLEPAYRDLVTSQRPEVTGVGPGGPDYAAGASSQPVLVSGSGFGPETQVFLGGTDAAHRAHGVRVLSANYLVATPPAGLVPGQVDVVVRTPAGTSATSSRDQYVLLPS